MSFLFDFPFSEMGNPETGELILLPCDGLMKAYLRINSLLVRTVEIS